ncbi:MAG: GNAT family N-acetyltransferase [Eubacteriales bacterium]
MAAIRPYESKDKENVREICLATGPKNAYEHKHRILLLACFCDYYVENEPQNCFVVADDNDDAVGYIMCAEDNRIYFKKFTEKYVPAARKAGFGWGIAAWITNIPLKYYVSKYPAHLHIDILPAYQHQGLGSRLMDALIANLKAKNVPSIMLVCGADNKNGLNFYKKYGFTQVVDVFGFVVMGMELT